MGQGVHFMEASRSHSDTPHSVRPFWTSGQPDAETSTWQHTTLTWDRYPSPRRDSNPNPSKRAATNQRRRRRGHRDRYTPLLFILYVYVFLPTVLLVSIFFNFSLLPKKTEVWGSAVVKARRYSRTVSGSIPGSVNGDFFRSYRRNHVPWGRLSL